MNPILVKNGTVVTLGSRNQVLKNHSILVSGGRIERIAPDSGTWTGPGTADGATVIDASNRVVLPGFINAHMHFYSTFARGLNKAAPSRDFQEVLRHLWWRLDRKLTLDDCYYSALVACIDAVKHGTTAMIDHHASPGAVRGSLPRIGEAVRGAGLKSCLCYELSDRDGGTVADEGMEENLAFIRECQSRKDPSLRALFGMHASFTIGDRTMRTAVEKARSLDAGFHIHAAEAASDQELTAQRHGIRVIERLHSAGVLGPKSICAHCVHVNEREMELLAESGTAVAHNPQSNMNNAVGVADLIRLKEKGVLVGLGTDAMTVNMLEELRSAVWIHKLERNDPGAGFMESVNTLISANAAIASRYWGEGTGQLREGGDADLAIIDYDPPTEFDVNTFAGHLVFGISQAAVDTTIAGGRILMQGKRLVEIDEERVMARARECSAELWKRF